MRIIFFTLLAIVIAGGIFIFNNERAQNALVRVALERQLTNQAEQSFGGDNIDIVFCGTASPMGAGSAQSCVAVFAGDQFFIVDSGARSASVAAALGLPLARLDGVLLTHFHSDHIAALGELHLASWVRGRAHKLDVYGGEGVQDIVNGFNLAYGQDYHYRTAHHGEAYVPSKYAGLIARTIAPPARGARKIYSQNGLTISVFRVTHEPIHPAYGFRFDYKGRSVVISGDTSSDENLVRVSKDVDLLIHEVLHRDLVRMTTEAMNKTGNEKLGKIIDDTHNYHTSPKEVMEIAKRAGVKKTAFYHYAPVPQNALMRRIYTRGIETDDLILPRDGTHIRLPIGSDEIIED